MQVIWCIARLGRSNSYCDHKSYLNRNVSIVPLLKWKKIESHFETWNSDAERINLTFVAYSFVANFVRYISAKYYLNWFLFHMVIMKVLGVNFFLKHSVVRCLPFIRTAKRHRCGLTLPTVTEQPRQCWDVHCAFINFNSLQKSNVFSKLSTTNRPNFSKLHVTNFWTSKWPDRFSTITPVSADAITSH